MPRFRAPYLLLTAALALWGCEEQVNPIDPTSRPFSLYGVVDPTSDRQAVRIFPIEGALFPAFEAAIDASVISRVLPSGPEVAWTDSSVAYPWYYGGQIPDTTWGNVFLAEFRPGFGETVEIVVGRSDGRESRVEVEVPERVLSVVEAPVAYPANVTLPVRYTGDVRLLGSWVTYTVSSPEATEPWVIRLEHPGPLPAYGSGTAVVSVPISADLGRIYAVTGLQPGTSDIFLLDLEIETFLVHPSWYPPGGRFDPELLVDPFVFTNVENGFGYVGSGYMDRLRWPVDQDVAVVAGFDRPPRP